MDVEIHIKRQPHSNHVLCTEIDGTLIDAVHVHRALTMTSVLAGARRQHDGAGEQLHLVMTLAQLDEHIAKLRVK